MSLFADDTEVRIPRKPTKPEKRRRKPRKRRRDSKKAEELKAKVRKKMESMVKTKEFLHLYQTLVVHADALQELYGVRPKLHKRMSLDELKRLYTEIHEGKYGKL